MSQFNSVVYDAAEKGNVDDLVALLATHGHLIDAHHPQRTQQTPLFIAAKNGHVGAVEKLVELGSQAIDVRNKFRLTPLAAAAAAGHVGVVEALVRLGCKEVDAANDLGMTPMFLAACDGYVEVIEALVRLGSKAIDTPDEKGMAPLSTAAAHGQGGAIETLLRLGSQAIDTADEEGWTPMHWAAWEGKVAALDALVRLGTKSLDAHDSEGTTPLFQAARVARWSGKLEASSIDCMTMLRAVGAKPLTDVEDLLDEAVEHLSAPLSEDQIAAVRHRVYFIHSLMQRLLLELDLLRSRTSPSTLVSLHLKSQE